LCGGKMGGDKKYDDPVTMANNLITEMKNIGIDCQIPPNLVRSGYGHPICTILRLLVDKALEVKNFSFKPTRIEEKIKGNKNDAPEIEDETPDVINMEIDYGDNLDSENKEKEKKEVEQENQDDDVNSIVYSGISSEDWQRELERLSSKLKLDYDNLSSMNSQEWKSRIETLRENQKNLKKKFLMRDPT
jgi:hypothetical protein